MTEQELAIAAQARKARDEAATQVALLAQAGMINVAITYVGGAGVPISTELHTSIVGQIQAQLLTYFEGLRDENIETLVTLGVV